MVFQKLNLSSLSHTITESFSLIPFVFYTLILMEFDKIGANVSGHQTTFRGYNYAIEMIIKVIVAIAHILYPSFSIIRIDNIVRWGGGYIEGVERESTFGGVFSP
jgi:hypothetical protein